MMPSKCAPTLLLRVVALWRRRQRDVQQRVDARLIGQTLLFVQNAMPGFHADALRQTQVEIVRKSAQQVEGLKRRDASQPLEQVGNLLALLVVVEVIRRRRDLVKVAVGGQQHAVAIDNRPARRFALVRETDGTPFAKLDHLMHKKRNRHQPSQYPEPKDKHPEAPQSRFWMISIVAVCCSLIACGAADRAASGAAAVMASNAP
jgi:hypothetical protein